MSAGWQGRPPGAPGSGDRDDPYRDGWSAQPPARWDQPERDTGERLRAALHARSAQYGPDQPTAPDAYGASAGSAYEGGWTRDDEGVGWGGGDPGRWDRPGGRHGGGRGGRQAPLFPRWAQLTLAVGLLLSAVLGVVLGLHASSSNSTPALPPARDTSYGEDRARVAITSFYRQGKFVTLELELTNLAPLGSDNSWSVNSAFSDSGYDLSGLRLLDPVSGASYRPAEDGKGDCICTNTVSLTIEPGSATRVSAQFAAPAPSVRKMTVNIPGVGSFPDVPLTDRS